jgi:hypothetical protein
MAGRLPVRSLLRLVFVAGLAATAGLCTVGGAPGLHARAAVAAAAGDSPQPAVTDLAGRLAAGPVARKVMANRGTAAYPPTSIRDLRGAMPPLSATDHAQPWPLVVHVAWAPQRLEHASRRMARVAGSSPGRAPPASARL